MSLECGSRCGVEFFGPINDHSVTFAAITPFNHAKFLPLNLSRRPPGDSINWISKDKTWDAKSNRLLRAVVLRKQFEGDFEFTSAVVD